jgi:multiple sugar transport system permease protein
VKGLVPTAERRAVWLFLTPALSLLAVFWFVPIVATIVLSLSDFDIYGIASLRNVRLVGPRNYLRLAQDPGFRLALRNTLYFAFVAGPLSVGVSLAAALLVNARLVRHRGLFQAVFLVPFVTTLAASAIVWRYLYQPRHGLVNYVLAQVGIGPIDWLGDPRWAMPSLILVAVWKSFGYGMLIFLAALQTIPRELYEAATLDGAKPWTRFIHITLPTLGPTLVLVALVAVIGFLQLFTEPYVMTQGGPLRSTTSLVFMMYEEGFRWWRMGNAAAVAGALLAMTLAGASVLRLRGAGT